MKNIVLVGFMGTGKTTIANCLAACFNFPVVDTDQLVEQNAGMSIKDIFALHGEHAFREAETAAIQQATKTAGKVISTGGGAVLRKENIECLKKTGVIVCLRACPETILERLLSCSDRPLLQYQDRLERIQALLSEREQYYNKADFFVWTDDKSKEQIVDEIENFLATLADWK